MASCLHRRTLIGNCELTLVEVGSARGAPGLPDPVPSPLPPMLIGPSGIAVRTRCDDDGDVDLEVWAGDPGAPPEGWEVMFEGGLETERRGFDAGTATASTFHIDAPPGAY